MSIELKPIVLRDENLESQTFLCMKILARFDLKNNVKSIGVIYIDSKENMLLYETGLQLRLRIEFYIDFSDFR